MSTPVEISVVIPVFNNQNSLSVLVGDIYNALLNKHSFEIILIDDGSEDKSWEKIKELKQSQTFSANIIAIKHKSNFGQENAKMAGLRMSSGKYVVFMDADYQHKAEDIIPLYEKSKQGFDICYANFSNKKKYSVKNIGSWLYNFLAYKFLNKPKGIYLSSFNMLNRKTADFVSLHTTPILNIDSIVLKYTQNISQIIVSQNKSLNTKKNYTFSKLLALFFRLLPGYSVKPLRFAFFMGLFVCFFALAGLVLCFFDVLLPFKIQISCFKTIVVILIGLVLFSIGVLGEYIGKIYIILHGAKQYEIETLITKDANN